MALHLYLPDSRLLRKFLDWAKESGWAVEYPDYGPDYKCSYFIMDKEKRFAWCSADVDMHVGVDLLSAVSIIREPVIITTIDKYNVLKTDEGIKAGCVSVSKEQIKTIYNATHNCNGAETYQLYMPEPFLLRQFLTWATQHGWGLAAPIKEPIWDSINYIILNSSYNNLDGNRNRVDYHPTISLDAAISLIKKEQSIVKIGNLDVTRVAGGIKVKDIFVPNSKIDFIYNTVCVAHKQEEV